MFQMENEINRDYLEEKILTTKSLFFFLNNQIIGSPDLGVVWPP